MTRTISERFSEQYDAVDRALLCEAKAEYAWRYGRDPWWVSLLVGFSIPFVVGGTALLLWIVFRTVWGWPIDGSWLQRLAG